MQKVKVIISIPDYVESALRDRIRRHGDLSRMVKEALITYLSIEEGKEVEEIGG